MSPKGISQERLTELLAKARANNPTLDRRVLEVEAAGYKRATDPHEQMVNDSVASPEERGLGVSPEVSPVSPANDTGTQFHVLSIEEISQLSALERVKYRMAEKKYFAEKSKIPTTTTEITNAINTLTSNSESGGVDRSTGRSISYNEKQLQFVQTASSGKSAVLIGSAGSGKTTCMRGVMEELIVSGRAGILEADGHKYLRDKTPGIVIVSFTRRAVSNIRKAVAEDMKGNCITIHALLEYEPVYHDVWDPETGQNRKTMNFEPTRHFERPLPASIRVCVIEEASMVSVDLYEELKSALPSNVQFIFLGDIQQLPPVFGAAILGYKMLELPVVELTEIYRQALESPIIRLAHRILSGVPIPTSEYSEWKFPNQLTIHPWKKKIGADLALNTIAAFLKQAADHGHYNPDDDMVLIPFNKSCGTLELNKHLAQHFARKRGVPVWEVIAGFVKGYYSVGDKVLYDKEDAVITKIEKNPQYDGAQPQPEGLLLDYWGYNEGTGGDSKHHVDTTAVDSDADIDFLLAQSAASGEDRVRQASHAITLKLLETGREITLDSAGALNALLLSFVLTVHKSQGSEFRKVFLMLHQSHATMLSRELLYTAVTRAKEELYIICEPESMTKGINSQRIQGNTLAEKAEYFKGKVSKDGKRG
jgi:exodeoxyribonuclease V alpha subunit